MASWNRSDPKPKPRVRASQAEWSNLHIHFSHARCVHCGQRLFELHHIMPRSQGGDDVPENLAPLCRLHHGILEGHESGWQQVAASVRKYVMTDSDRRRYQEQHAGESFNRRYPPLANTDPQFQADREKLFARHAGEIE